MVNKFPKKRLNGLKVEKNLARHGNITIVGIDEAGRGPLAGPVAAAAVAVVDLKCRDGKFLELLAGVKDSKKISSKKREEIFKKIISCENIVWAVAMETRRTIDKINIFEASKKAMTKASCKAYKKIKKLNGKKESEILLVIDGNFQIPSRFSQKSIIKADNKVFSCSAASIIAKVSRDNKMKRMDAKFPYYEFSVNKGYPTKKHLAALSRFGPCKEHRRSFAPVRKIWDNLCKKSPNGKKH